MVSLASLPGTIGTRRVLDSSVRLTDVALAANANGQAAIAWTEDKGFVGRRANNDRLYLSLRPAGGRFGKPSVIVGSGKLAGVSVAYGARGDLLVAFERRSIGSTGRTGPRRVQVRFRRAGHGFGAITDLGPHQGITDLVTAVTPAGRGYAAWGTQDGGIEANDPFNVYAATKLAGPRAFGSAVHLFSGEGGDVVRPGGRLGLGTSGEDALLAFTGIADGGPGIGTVRPVLASATDARGTFGPPALVAGGNGVVGGVAVQPDGSATIVWTGQRPARPTRRRASSPRPARPAARSRRSPSSCRRSRRARCRCPRSPRPAPAAPSKPRGLERNVGIRVSRRG